MRALSLVAILTTCSVFSGEPVPPQSVPPDAHPEGVEIRKKVDAIVLKLGADDFQTRQNASEELGLLGPRAVPLIARHVNHHDPEVAWRVRKALSRMKGAPGEAVEGLTLAAALVGPRPRQGETVTLWLTITNTSDHDVYFMQYFWDLALQPEEQKSTAHARTVSVSTGAELGPHDFLCLKPGEGASYLMDADPIPAAKGAQFTNAYLEMPLPAKAKNIIKDSVFSGSRELVSGPIEITYAEESARPTPAAVALRDLILNKPEEASDKLKAAPEALEAIRLGLRLGEERERTKIFDFLCKNMRAEFEDDMVDYLGRLGPRTKQEGAIIKNINAFAKILPEERRRTFLWRVLLSMPHDWRTVTNIARDYNTSPIAKDRSLAAQAFLLLYERGDRRPEVMDFLAWELFTSTDPGLKNPEKALEIAQLASKAAPNRIDYRFAVAFMAGKKDEMEKLADSASTPTAQNAIAWDLATKFPVGTGLMELAEKLSRRAVAGAKPGSLSAIYYKDTLAVVLAAKGDYVNALDLEQQAFDSLPKDDDERPHYAARIAYFTALASGNKDERPLMVVDAPRLTSDKSRDALLARLSKEQQPLIRGELRKLLKNYFGNEEKVMKALAQP